jgi:hypothetical protein
MLPHTQHYRLPHRFNNACPSNFEEITANTSFLTPFHETDFVVVTLCLPPFILSRMTRDFTIRAAATINGVR